MGNMKTVVYITRKKIWAGKTSFDWDGTNLDAVFGKIKKELKVKKIRVVLGNDVSFVTAIKAEDTFLSRENVLKMVKPWIPFEIDSNCFDWKQIMLGHDEIWLQVIASEKEFLSKLSTAVLKNGLEIDLVSAIGVLLGGKSKNREVPVVIKWTEKESVSVLAMNGLVDLVVSEINEEDLMIYAKQKWNLAVNPEMITMSEQEFNLSENVFSEKTKGEDKVILNLPILKDLMETEKNETEIQKTSVENKIWIEERKEKQKSKLWMYLIFLLLIVGVGAATMYQTGLLKAIFSKKVAVNEVVPSISPTVEITPEPTGIDLSVFQVQVLNGSGITGEAAKIKASLLVDGFEKVITGNTEATSGGKILAKESVPEMVVDTVRKHLADDYTMQPNEVLESDEKYDLIVIIGSEKKL